MINRWQFEPREVNESIFGLVDNPYNPPKWISSYEIGLESYAQKLRTDNALTRANYSTQRIYLAFVLIQLLCSTSDNQIRTWLQIIASFICSPMQCNETNPIISQFRLPIYLTSGSCLLLIFRQINAPFLHQWAVHCREFYLTHLDLHMEQFST